MKVCSCCKQSKPYSKFYKNPNTLDRLGSMCKECDTSELRKRRTERKRKLVEYFGGECRICRYKKHFGALEFHHVDPAKKDLNMSGTHSFLKMLKEAKKCLLVCSNCHREIHAGVLSSGELSNL